MPNASPLKDMEGIAKTSLTNHRRLAYMDFRKNLSPNYARVFFDIFLGYAFLGAGLFLPLALARANPGWVLPLTLACALSTGYWIAYLQLFIHEAAHFNIALSKKWNDGLSNLLIASWAGQNTSSYRVIHWDHHRYLGRPNDTEHSYFEPLNLRFFLYSLSGVAALRVILFRQKQVRTQKKLGDLIMRMAGLALHGTIMGLLLAQKELPFALAWGAGVLFFFPFFGSLRQLLEHRDEKADAQKDYSKIPHGKTTRMFKEGPLGSTLGAAGFTRHLLHHWDPQISYTRLAEVEYFLMGTRLQKSLAASKTTHLKTFFRLLEF